MDTTRLTLAAVGVAGASLLAGCGGSSAFCDAVNDDMAASAVAFNPVIVPAASDGPNSIEGRLAFLEAAGQAPDGLEDEWETYRTYLEDLDPETFTPEPDDVAEARDALFDASMECRS